MLDVKDLQFGYKNHPVLKGVSFQLNPGECVCLLGENGAGKTTLFKCIMGFFSGYKGSISVDDSSISAMSSKEIAKKIAYIPQTHAPTFNYSVNDIVLMGTNALTGSFSGPGRKEMALATEMLELMGIEHLGNRGYAELSGGERQLVLIARALAQQSKILVMDEPTANLDYGNQFKVMKQVKKLAQQGYSILISTHNPEHALYFGDKAMILNDGQKMLYGTPQDILTPGVIDKIYGVGVEIHSAQTRWGQVKMIAPCLE